MRADDRGFTLTEVMLGMALASLLVAVAFAVVSQTSTAFKGTAERSRNNDEVGLAIGRLDRMIRSGNILYDPASESDPGAGIQPGLSMRIYTQANSTQKCVQWRILAGRLQERSWSPQWELNGLVTDWWNVADGLANTTTTPAFALAPDPAFGGRLLVVDLRVNVSSSDAAEVAQRVAIQGRNTQYGYDEDVCDSIPT